MRQVSGLLVSLVIAFGLLAGCGAAPQSARTEPSQPASGEWAVPPAADFASGGASGIAPSAPAPAATAAPAAKPASSAYSTNNQASVPWDRMVIRTASLSLTVKNVDDALRSLRDLSRVHEGFIANSQTRQDRNQTVATVTIQVPARNFDALIQQARELAVKVQTEQVGSQDVTEEFVDLQSQLRNLQATEASLLKLLDRAERIEDILALQRELTNVRGQIERLQGRINYLQRRSDMSTLVVSLTPEGFARTDEPVWQPLRTVERAWRASLELIQGLLDVLLAAVVFLWWAVPLGALVVWLIRRRRSRRAQAPALQTAQPSGQPPSGT